MLKYFLLALGGALGTVLRYIVSGIDYRLADGIFPASTLAVNLAGSLGIGFFWGLFEQVSISPQTRLFIFMGIFGGFTTFSTFSLENFHLLRDGEYKIALLNIILSNLFGIILVFAGYFIALALINLLVKRG